MDGLIKLVQGFVNQSAEIKKSTKSGQSHDKWKYCVALEKAGYKAKCEAIENSQDLLFIWEKEREEVKIRLSFIEQQRWLEYLQKRLIKKGEGK
jgi:hypothetical protein